jgi:predicted DNA-binding transcriptional regulator YafY
MKKSEIILQTVLNILHSPRQQISENELKKLFGKSKSTFYRYVDELTKFELVDGEPALRKIKEDDSFIYTLNKNMFKYFIPEHLETGFYMEAYKKLGSMLENPQFAEDVDYLKKEILQLNGRGEQLERKFYYLSKVSSNETKPDCTNQADSVRALIDNQVISLFYNNKKYDPVYPLALCQYRDSLYLIAYKEKEKPENIRKFKLNRIQSIEVLEDKFFYPPRDVWNPENYFKDSSGIITDKPVRCEIKVYGHSRGLIAEKDFFGSKLLDSSEHYDRYELCYSNVQEFLGQAFIYAQDIEIVGPDDLRDEFVNKALGAIKRNKLLRAA